MSSVVEYGGRRIAVVAAVMLAALMQLADTTIVNVALPSIDGALGASVDEGAWFVTAYIIANVIVIPLTPWLQSMVGRRRYFALSIAGFTIVSVMCGLAHDATTEIVLRFVQGAFGGGLMVPAQQIIRDTFPPEQLGKSQSLFALAIVCGPTIGPTLGGFLTDDVSWRWVFFINLLPGIVATLLVLAFVRDPEAPHRVAADGIGVGLLALGLGTMQYALDEGERLGWFDDGTIVACFVIAIVALGLFVYWELYGTKHPAVALRVFRERNVWGNAILYFVVGGAIYGLVFVQPQYVQNTLHFTTTLAGMLLMVRTAMLVLLYPVTTWIVSQKGWDLRWVAAAGIAVLGISTWIQSDAMTTGSDFGSFVVTQALGGVGMAFVWVPLAVILLQGLPAQSVAPALALTRLSQQIGASVGSAFAAVLLDRGFDTALNTLAGSISLGNANVAAAVQANGATALATLSAMTQAEAANIAAVGATRWFALATVVAAVCPFVLRLRVASTATVTRPLALPERGYMPPHDASAPTPARVERVA